MKTILSRIHVAACAFLLALAPSQAGAAPRVLPAGELPADARLAPRKDLDGYFPFTPSATPEEWATRASLLRRQILVSQGLWPMPDKSPLNAVVHGRIERGDYSVEKVYFESMPGFFVTGSLYRPVGRPGKLPGVLCPHGHWDQGRFMETKNIRQELANGGERFEEGGKSVLQARCVQLARMGCVVFHYDMIGYADSIQIPLALAHGFAKQRPEMNTIENWGLFSPQAESRFQSVMGLQTWNSIRSLDFLLGLDDVDASRIGVTGASGGGTQTFILSAIDPRVTVAFPAVMVGTAMQGGCTCENACGLRIDAGNVDFAALFAPKPLGMTGADDWTREMGTKGFPELKRHYAMLGAPDNVMFKPLNHFGHNYNHPSRVVMYGWMNRHLKLGMAEPVLESDYTRLTAAEMTVWDAQHPAPAGGPDFERRLLRQWSEDTARKVATALSQPDTSREVVVGGLEVVIGRGLPKAGTITYTTTASEDLGTFSSIRGLMRDASRREETPALFFLPKDWKGRVVVWVHPDGKSGLCEDPASDVFRPNASVQRLVDAGIAVAGVDLLYQGEFLKPGESLTQTPKVGNPREAAPYTFGYNPSVCAERVRDVLKLLSFVKHHERAPRSVEIVGLAGAGHWVAAARALAGSVVDRAVIDTAGFRFGGVTSIRDPQFLPGGAQYGDVPGMIAASGAGKVWLAGEPETFTAGLSNVTPGKGGASEAVDWLLQSRP